MPTYQLDLTGTQPVLATVEVTFPEGDLDPPAHAQRLATLQVASGELKPDWQPVPEAPVEVGAVSRVTLLAEDKEQAKDQDQDKAEPAAEAGTADRHGRRPGTGGSPSQSQSQSHGGSRTGR